MIPLLIGAGIAGILGLGGVAVAKDTQKEAENTLDEARDIYDSAKRSLEIQQNNTENALKRLGDEKYRILTGVITEFVVAFNKFKNIDFKQSHGINELDNLKFEEFTKSDLLSIQKLAETGDSLAKGAMAGGAAGAAIALGAGAASVNALLGAGTMSAFAGAVGIGGAAELAIAGVGGLAPALGIVAGPALLIGGFAAFCKADENLQKAKSALAEANVAAQQMETAEYLCRQIERRSEMFSELLDELEPLLRASVQELNRLSGLSIKVSVPKKRGALVQFFANLFKIQLKDKYVTKTMKKNDYNNLNVDEKKFLAMSGAIAKAIKSVVDTPILDSTGEVTSESEKVYDNISNALPDYRTNQPILINCIS